MGGWEGGREKKESESVIQSVSRNEGEGKRRGESDEEMTRMFRKECL